MPNAVLAAIEPAHPCHPLRRHARARLALRRWRRRGTSRHVRLARGLPARPDDALGDPQRGRGHPSPDTMAT